MRLNAAGELVREDADRLVEDAHASFSTNELGRRLIALLMTLMMLVALASAIVVARQLRSPGTGAATYSVHAELSQALSSIGHDILGDFIRITGIYYFGLGSGGPILQRQYWTSLFTDAIGFISPSPDRAAFSRSFRASSFAASWLNVGILVYGRLLCRQERPRGLPSPRSHSRRLRAGER